MGICPSPTGLWGKCEYSKMHGIQISVVLSALPQPTPQHHGENPVTFFKATLYMFGEGEGTFSTFSRWLIKQRKGITGSGPEVAQAEGAETSLCNRRSG